MNNVVNISPYPKELFGWWAHWFEVKVRSITISVNGDFKVSHEQRVK